MWYREYFCEYNLSSPNPLIMSTLFEINHFGKLEYPLRCPHCATSMIIRYGTYLRSYPEEKSRQVAVQRYLCKQPNCPWKTFSILPYPFLPIVRHFYQTLLLCHCLCNVKNISQAATARQLHVTRGIVKRLGIFCRRFIPWLNHEKEFADWGPDPEGQSAALWPDFTRDFSQTFYPKRWSPPLPTQLIPTCFQ